MNINLGNVPVTLATLAQIVTALESGETVTICNAARPTFGPGISALLLGQATGQAALAEAVEKRLEALERAVFQPSS